MGDDIVGMFAKSQSEMIVGSVGEWDGELRADLRTALPSVDGDGSLVMTKKGVSVPVGLFDEVVKALGKLNGLAASRAIGGRIPKGTGTEIRVSLEPYGGDVYCHVRTYFTKKESPGRGIAVRAAMLPQLIELAERMAEEIRARTRDPKL